MTLKSVKPRRNLFDSRDKSLGISSFIYIGEKLYIVKAFLWMARMCVTSEAMSCNIHVHPSHYSIIVIQVSLSLIQVYLQQHSQTLQTLI